MECHTENQGYQEPTTLSSLRATKIGATSHRYWDRHL